MPFKRGSANNPVDLSRMVCAFVPGDFPAEDARPFELRHRLVFRTARRTDSQVGQAKEHNTISQAQIARTRRHSW